jgi:GGDEF domain-containing protein
VSFVHCYGVLHPIKNSFKFNYATTIGRKVLESIQDSFVVSGHQIFATASIGIAFYPDDGNEVDTLANRADEAMYSAKQKGFDNSHSSLQSLYAEPSG